MKHLLFVHVCSVLLNMFINFQYIFLITGLRAGPGADGGSESLLILSVSNLFFGFLLARRQMLVFGYDSSAGGRT